MRRPITLALLLVAAGILSAVAVTWQQTPEPDVYCSTKPVRIETGLKARVDARDPLKQVMLDFPEVGTHLELQVMQRVGEERLPLGESKTLITGVHAAAKNALMPVPLFVDGQLVAEGEVRVSDLDRSYLIVSHGETGTRLELVQPQLPPVQLPR